MTDTDQFSTKEIVAMTAVGESDRLGHVGMAGTVCTAVNRAKANLHWMGGSDVRNVCLAHDQYDVWWPATDNEDRQRVFDIATKNPLYGPYVDALGIAVSALAGTLPDCTNGAVTYYDSDECACPRDLVGKAPCHIEGARIYFDLAAVI
jgi:hypothetical protein